MIKNKLSYEELENKVQELQRDLKKAEEKNIEAQKLYQDFIKTQTDLEIRETKFRLVFENTLNSILWADTSTGVLILANPAALKLFERTEDELIGQPQSILHPTEKIDEYITMFKNHIKLGGVKNMEAEIITKSGKIKYVEISSTIINLGNRVINQGIFKDITEQKKSEYKLKEAEDRFKTFYNTIPDGITITRLQDGLFVDANTTFYEHTGYLPNDIIGKTTMQVNLWSHPEQREQLASELKENGFCNNFEVTTHCKNGSDLVGILSAKIIMFNGTPHIVSVVRDMAKRIKMEKEIKVAKERFEMMYNTIPDAIAFTRLQDGYFVDVNKGFYDYTGYNAKDINGKTTSDIKLWNNPEQRKKLVSNLNEKGYCDNLEITTQCKDGKILSGILSAKIINFDETPHILSIVRDISARKKAEELLKQSEEKYRLIAENTSDVIWVIDPQTFKYKYISPSVINLTGFTVEEIIHENIIDSINPESAESLINRLRKKIIDINAGIENEKSGIEEMQRLHKDGSLFWIEVSVQAITNKDGQVTDIIGVSRNIEQRKSAELEIKEKNEKLTKLNATKDKFFSIIAHDLRSPIGTLYRYSEILKEEIEKGDCKDSVEYADIINSKAKHMMELTDNLLEWAMSQKNKIKPITERIELNKLLSLKIETHQSQAAQKEIKLILEKSNTVYVSADSNMLKTILRNLISNAIKFTIRKGWVKISVKEKDKYAEISIADNGIGMSEATIAKLFRIDQSNSNPGTENEKGTGLGLILCKEFVEFNKGKIWAESNNGKGSIFKFTIPL